MNSLKRRPIRQRPKRIIENLPDSTLQEYLRALVDLRDKSENAIYKVDLALAIIKRHPKINVTKLCSSIMNTENLFDLMAEYLGDEFKKYGFNLHDFYNSNHRQIDCPLLHHNLPCPNIRFYSPDEGTAIQRALAFLEDAPRYLTKSAIKVENQNLGQDQSETRYFVITDPQWTKMPADAELGTTWIDQVYEALAECYINKIILNTDEEDGEVPSMSSLPYNISEKKEDKIRKQWEQHQEDKDHKDGILCLSSPDCIEIALESHYGFPKKIARDPLKIKKHLKSKIFVKNLQSYFKSRCGFQLKNLRNWGYDALILKKLIREYFDSIDIADCSKPGSDQICRQLTDEEKNKDPLYKFHPHDKNPCLHFILSTGMWGQRVIDFMRDSGHSLAPYDYNDLVVRFLLNNFQPSSSRQGLKKINKCLHLIYSDKYSTTTDEDLQKKLVKSFKANRFPLEWYKCYDKIDELPLMDKIKDGCLA